MQENLLSRKELAELFGVSPIKIRNLEVRKKFSGPTIPSRGCNEALYSEEKVIELRKYLKGDDVNVKEITSISLRPYSPEEGKKAFVMLEKGVPPQKLVSELGIHPHSVRAIVADFADLAGGFFLDAKTLESIHKLPLDGCFPLEGPAALLELLTDCSSDVCFVCKKRSKTVCSHCSEARR